MYSPMIPSALKFNPPKTTLMESMQLGLFDLYGSSYAISCNFVSIKCLILLLEYLDLSEYFGLTESGTM